jgi:hypothetical protein
MSDEFPAELAEVAAAGWRRQIVARNDRDSAALAARFTAYGLHPIVLKGPATRAALGEASERTSSDVDLLVGPAEFNAAERLLRSVGYRRVKGVHADTWWAPGQPDVDLHWTIPRVGVDARRVWEVLDSCRVPLLVGDGQGGPGAQGGRIEVLAPGARLVHLAIHATLDATGRPQDDLRGAAARLTPADWEAAATVARDLNVAESVAWALASVGLDADAARFGRPHLEPAMPHEAGFVAFVRSRVHWRERLRRQQRLTEKWATWNLGRLGRLVTGRARLNQRIAMRLRGRP